MKYLKKFNTQAEYETYVGGGGDYVTPNVSFIEHVSTQEEQQVRFQPYIPPPAYLTFTAEQAESTINLTRVGTNLYPSLGTLTDAVLQYSVDDGETWNNYTLGTDITLTNVGDSVKFKGTNTTLAVYGTFHKFVMTGRIKASGDVTSLLNEKGGDATLAKYCYNYLFKDCTSLTQAPELPATTLAFECYSSMFWGCTGLTQAPKLPATTLAQSCYYYMFKGCTSLTQAPELPAKTLASYCYHAMFYDCTSLTTTPSLPATTLAQYCYHQMFYGCTGLIQTSELPVMTLVKSCYSQMFKNCTSLTQAPELPAITLVQYCYDGMFEDCTNLRYIKAMFTTTPSLDYTGNWVPGVASSGTFVKNSAATWNVTGRHGIPEGWTVETAAA